MILVLSVFITAPSGIPSSLKRCRSPLFRRSRLAKSRKLLKGERMSRVERDGKYFVMQMHEKFNKEFTVEGIESYLDKVKGKRKLLQ